MKKTATVAKVFVIDAKAYDAKDVSPDGSCCGQWFVSNPPSALFGDLVRGETADALGKRQS